MIYRESYRRVLFFIVILFVNLFYTNISASNKITYDESLYSAMRYRCIGPFRGGRSAAVAGVVGDPMTYYFGGTGGGVWKTTDGGQKWKNISDGFFGGSIGAVAVSEWDPNVIYVGGGEVTVRGNVSHGYGMWKSTDRGKSWKCIGLKDSRHITRIRIHPRNPDVVYAAVLGHLYGPNEQRGVYRTTDGGESWKRILFVNSEVGAVDIAMDPTNPRILFATMWRVRRTPYSLESGGEGSGIWQSTDGGDSWINITGKGGLPGGKIGIIGVTVSPANPDRIWAIVEAADGGVFRSDDGGESWHRVNDERKLRQRAWYYTRIYADPKNQDIVYVLNVRFWKSKDGGRTYQAIHTPHGDHHDLWIDPENPDRMIIADDGGAQVTFDGGKGWSTYYNQPTAQFYRVSVDNHFPYRIYGAQQDNSAIRILSWSDGGSITERDWESTAGGESGWIVPNPQNPEVVYGGSYGGYLARLDHKTGQMRMIDVWPDNPMGHGAKDLKYRFQWNFPIFFSPHDPQVLYTAGNCLFKTTNEGQSWTRISPDLTRNDTTKLGPSGGPITKDNTGVEYYCTIFTAVESPIEPDVIWTGSDDGLIYLTRDGGKHWINVTPPKRIMPEWIQINSIEASPFEPGCLYVAATMYKWDDFHPYLYKTTDYGKRWKKIVDGIDENHFTRVVRCDPERRGLLYAGTESGVYISFDDGESWKKFQLNLPVVPVTDMVVKNNDLIVATQGRSFWILDDLTPLHQLSEEVANGDFWLFKPRPTYRFTGGSYGGSAGGGENRPGGVVIYYYFKDRPEPGCVSLKILDSSGRTIKTFTPESGKAREKLTTKRGMNRFVWNMRYPDAESFEGMILWGGSVRGPKALPGLYNVRLISGRDSIETSFEILKDPRSSSTLDDLKAQFDFLIEIRDKLSETHRAIKRIRDMKRQIGSVIERVKRCGQSCEIEKAGEELICKISRIENALYQTKNQSRQDPLNFPIKLNNRLASLATVVSTGEFRPTNQALDVKNLLIDSIDKELEKLNRVIETDLSEFNRMVNEQNIPAVVIENESKK